MCPIVPMLTCGLLRSNFSLAIALSAPQLERSLEPCGNPLPARLPHGPSGRFGDHFLGNRYGRFLVMREMHRETGAALSAAAEVGCIAEHFRQRHLRADNLGACPGFVSLDLRTPRVQVA